MTRKMTRKGFLGTATGGMVLLLLQACGGGGDSGSGSTSGSGTGSGSGSGSGTGSGSGASGGLTSCTSTGGAILGNHGHALEIPAADLESKVDVHYSIQGTSNHPHTITLTPAQLAALKGGQSVTVTSSTDFSHSHDVTITCA
jgi:hypothetical protein